MKKNYSICSLDSLRTLPQLDSAQFLLNLSFPPASRHTVESIMHLRETCDTDLWIHYDCLRIASRYSMLKKEFQDEMIDEIVDIMIYSQIDTHLKGIVMYTDYPTILYDTPVYLFNSVKDYSWYESIQQFYEDLLAKFNAVKVSFHKPACKVYFENSVILGPQGEGSVTSIESLFHVHPEYNELFGICIDTQHYAAVSEVALQPHDIENILVDSKLVHLNAIPEGTLGKGIDSHNITLFDCSVYDFNYYKYFMLCLDSLCIPWIREVHDTTMFKEFDLINQYNANQNSTRNS